MVRLSNLREGNCSVHSKVFIFGCTVRTVHDELPAVYCNCLTHNLWTCIDQEYLRESIVHVLLLANLTTSGLTTKSIDLEDMGASGPSNYPYPPLHIISKSSALRNIQAINLQCPRQRASYQLYR